MTTRSPLRHEERMIESLRLSGWNPRPLADGSWTVAKGPLSAWAERLTPELVARLRRLENGRDAA